MFNNIKENSSENYGECYICFNITNELSKCLCKNVFLHIECQKKFINDYKKIKCSICDGKFSNIIIKNNCCMNSSYFLNIKPKLNLDEASINISKNNTNIIIYT